MKILDKSINEIYYPIYLTSRKNVFEKMSEHTPCSIFLVDYLPVQLYDSVEKDFSIEGYIDNPFKEEEIAKMALEGTEIKGLLKDWLLVSMPKGG